MSEIVIGKTYLFESWIGSDCKHNQLKDGNNNVLCEIIDEDIFIKFNGDDKSIKWKDHDYTSMGINATVALYSPHEILVLYADEWAKQYAGGISMPATASDFITPETKAGEGVVGTMYLLQLTPKVAIFYNGIDDTQFTVNVKCLYIMNPETGESASYDYLLHSGYNNALIELVSKEAGRFYIKFMQETDAATSHKLTTSDRISLSRLLLCQSDRQSLAVTQAIWDIIKTESHLMLMPFGKMSSDQMLSVVYQMLSNKLLIIWNDDINPFKDDVYKDVMMLALYMWGVRGMTLMKALCYNYGFVLGHRFTGITYDTNSRKWHMLFDDGITEEDIEASSPVFLD